MKLKAYTKKIEDNKYIAHLIDFDLMTYGETPLDAIHKVIEQFKLYTECVELDKENGLRTTYKRPAPFIFHLQWWLAKLVYIPIDIAQVVSATLGTVLAIFNIEYLDIVTVNIKDNRK